MAKRKRDSTAAYAASQPLFDVLKDACDKLEPQATNLAMARDLVQTLHVKLDQVRLDTYDEALGPDHHERYLDGIMSSYAAATESYRHIFEQLSLLTAADPAAGKPAAGAHDDYERIFESMASAHAHALQFLASQNRSRGGAGRERQTEEHGTNQAHTENDAAADLQTMQKKSPASRQGPPLKQRKRTSSKTAAVAALDPVKDINRSPFGLPLAKLTLEAKVATEPTVFVKDGVKYEDVSAEVAARLQAKHEKKSAEKLTRRERKRKRESTDSQKAHGIPHMLPHQKKAKRTSLDLTHMPSSAVGKRKSRDSLQNEKQHEKSNGENSVAKRRRRKSNT